MPVERLIGDQTSELQSVTQLANLRDGLREAIEEELARDGRWSLVKQRGPDVLALLAFTAVMMSAAVLRFRKRLD